MIVAVWIGAHIWLIPLAGYTEIANNPKVRLFDTFKFNHKAEIVETYGRG